MPDDVQRVVVTVPEPACAGTAARTGAGRARGRARRGLAVLGLSVALTAGGVVPAVGPATAPAAADSVADRKRQVDRELAEIRETLEGTAAELVEASVALRRAELLLVDARRDLAAAQAAADDARRKDEALAARVQFTEAEVRKADRQLAEHRAAEDETRAALGQIAREAYLTGGMTSLSVALDAENPDDFSERMAVAGTALRVQNGAIARLDVQEAESRARSAKLEALRAEVAELKRQSERLVRLRVAAEAKAAQAKASVEQLVAQQAAAVKVIEARKAAEQARQDALEAQQARLRAVLAERARQALLAERARRARGSAPPPAPAGDGVLARPASGPITSPFGMRMHPIFRVRKLHSGTDFGTGCGNPVYASAAGTVVISGWGGGYGNRVVVDHGVVRGVGLATTYNHLSRIVKGSGRVARGQLVGYAGTTGSSTGCHLHFEVLVNGSFVDPMDWL